MKSKSLGGCLEQRHYSEIREFISAIVDMTEGAANIDKRSIVRPGVTLRTEAKRLLKLLDRNATNTEPT